MRKLGVFLVLIFLISFASTLKVDFSCPNSVEVGEEFSCSIDFSGNYDVKVDLLCGNSRCAKVWNGDFWGSTYYFIKDFSGDEIKLKIVDDFSGNCEGKLRLRESGTSGYNYEESFSIDVEESSFVEKEESSKEETVEYGEETTEIVKLDSEKNVIVLNSVSFEDKEEEIIYESKNEKIGNYAVFGFAFFLIFVIMVLVVGR